MITMSLYSSYAFEGGSLMCSADSLYTHESEQTFITEIAGNYNSSRMIRLRRGG